MSSNWMRRNRKRGKLSKSMILIRSCMLFWTGQSHLGSRDFFYFKASRLQLKGLCVVSTRNSIKTVIDSKAFLNEFRSLLWTINFRSHKSAPIVPLKNKNGKMVFAKLIFFPPKIFLLRKIFLFQNTKKKVLAGKKLT